MESQASQWLSSISLVALVLGAAAFLIGYIGSKLLDAVVGRATQKTTGTYLGKGRYLEVSRVRTWIPRVRYQVQGESYEREMSYAENILESTPAGTEVDVHYDPADPAFAYAMGKGKLSSIGVVKGAIWSGVGLVTCALLLKLAAVIVR